MDSTHSPERVNETCPECHGTGMCGRCANGVCMDWLCPDCSGAGGVSLETFAAKADALGVSVEALRDHVRGYWTDDDWTLLQTGDASPTAGEDAT